MSSSVPLRGSGLDTKCFTRFLVGGILGSLSISRLLSNVRRFINSENAIQSSEVVMMNLTLTDTCSLPELSIRMFANEFFFTILDSFDLSASRRTLLVVVKQSYPCEAEPSDRSSN